MVNHGGQEGANNNGDLGELTDFATDLMSLRNKVKLILLLVAITEIQRVIQIPAVELKNNPVLSVNLV